MVSGSVLLSAAALILPAAVQAATSSASINDVSIRLFDLNIADAITPQVVWQTAQSVVQVSGHNVDLAQTFNDAAVSPTFMAGLSESGMRTSVSAMAAITGDSLAASGQALAPRTEFESVARTGQTSFNAGVLSAFSQLVFTATGFTTVNAYNFCTQNNFQSCSYATSDVSLSTAAGIFGGNTLQGASASVTANGPNTDTLLGDSQSVQFS